MRAWMRMDFTAHFAPCMRASRISATAILMAGVRY
jgi:hypothetical protein